MTKKVAVVLCGSGFKDGSEIRESVGALWALSMQKAEFQCFAPDKPQTEVINSVSGAVMPNESRNMLIEAARIARGQILPLSKLKAEAFNAIIMPGGLGAVKNLSDFATKGSGGTVLPELQKVLETMHTARKPIGAICIAPAILALAFKGRGLELTVGQICDASKEIEKLGHKHIVCAANGCSVDSSFRVVSTPAYMYDNAPLCDIFMGIQKLVTEVLRLVP